MPASSDSERIRLLEQIEATVAGLIAEAEARQARFEQLAASSRHDASLSGKQAEQAAGTDTLAGAEDRAAALVRQAEEDLAAVENGLRSWLESADRLGQRFAERAQPRNLAARQK